MELLRRKSILCGLGAWAGALGLALAMNASPGFSAERDAHQPIEAKQRVAPAGDCAEPGPSFPEAKGVFSASDVAAGPAGGLMLPPPSTPGLTGPGLCQTGAGCIPAMPTVPIPRLNGPVAGTPPGAG